MSPIQPLPGVQCDVASSRTAYIQTAWWENDDPGAGEAVDAIVGLIAPALPISLAGCCGTWP